MGSVLRVKRTARMESRRPGGYWATSPPRFPKGRDALVASAEQRLRQLQNLDRDKRDPPITV